MAYREDATAGVEPYGRRSNKGRRPYRRKGKSSGSELSRITNDLRQLRKELQPLISQDRQNRAFQKLRAELDKKFPKPKPDIRDFRRRYR